jgi:predicted transcriptional regulator with HTH domain
MAPTTRRRHWPADRIPLQRAVMALALEVYPHWRTIPELAREVGSYGALTRAVLELIGMGLLESHGSAVRPTKPVAHLERLRLP